MFFWKWLGHELCSPSLLTGLRKGVEGLGEAFTPKCSPSAGSIARTRQAMSESLHEMLQTLDCLRPVTPTKQQRVIKVMVGQVQLLPVCKSCGSSGCHCEYSHVCTACQRGLSMASRLPGSSGMMDRYPRQNAANQIALCHALAQQGFQSQLCT